jgi:DNA-binding PadR family transcriptional regulator
MDPCDEYTLISILPMSEPQIRTTIKSLVNKGFLASWVRSHDQQKTYVPTLTGVFALGADAPRPEAVREARVAANPML